MRCGSLAALTLLALFLGACGGNSQAVIVSVSPSAITLVLQGTQQFTATVTGSSNQNVNWSVSGSGCNGNACGTITSTGLYTAPSGLPNPASVTVTASAQAAPAATGTATVGLDSGIRVVVTPANATLGPGERFSFTAQVTGTATLAVNWTVNNVANGDTTNGQICLTGTNPCQAPGGPVSGTVDYLAPATITLGLSTLQATSTVDTSRLNTASVTLLNPQPGGPNLTSLAPSSAQQGSVFQDVYLAGSNFFSTSTVLLNGVPMSSTFLSTNLLRVRIPSCIPGGPSPPGCPGNLLQNAGSIAVAVQSQEGITSPTLNLTVKPARPAVTALLPDSVPQCTAAPCPSANLRLHGGYFTAATTAVFNGDLGGTTASPVNSNQLTVGIPGADLGPAGLSQLVISNPGAAPPSAALNLAVEPSAATISPNPIATLAVGKTPSAVAINTVTDQAVVVNSGDTPATVSVINLAASPLNQSAVSSIPVGHLPTSVAVDYLRDLAFVVNQGDNTLSVIDLSGVNPPKIVMLPAGSTPVSIGYNPLTRHALVTNQLTNTATVLDLSNLNAPVATATANISTGLSPAATIAPDLDWAVVTSGGAGATSIVDLSHTFSDPTTGKPDAVVIATVTFATSVQGVGLNTENGIALLSDPSNNGAALFSIYDQTVETVVVGTNQVAAAVNPLTNVGILVSNRTNSATLVDMGTPTQITNIGGIAGNNTIPVGMNPVAVAVDPASNVAVVVNQGDGTVSVLALGALRSLHITQIGPTKTFTSAVDLPLTVVGHGFSSGTPVVRLDGTPVPTTVNSDRLATATVPHALLAAPHRFAVDVQNTISGAVSNVEGLTVIQPVPVGTAPVAVAVGQVNISGQAHDLAVVTNSGSNTVTVVDINNPTVCPIPNCTIAVGNNPQGVDVLGRLGRAIVTNRGDNTASLVDLVNGVPVPPAIAVGLEPLGVPINPDTAVAAVANATSNTLSLVSLVSGNTAGTIGMDMRPVGLAVDPVQGLAVVANATQNTVALVDLVHQLIISRPNNLASPYEQPTAVAFDPVGDLFMVANSLLNIVDVVDPNSQVVTPVRIGINPTSIAYNFQSDTLLTVNTASHTVSVMDFLGRRVRGILGVDGSPQQAVAIDPLSNFAVVADQANNRVLLVPLPH